jgi:hypothetical protein
MSTSLLTQVRSIAKKAAKAGTNWHIQKSGELACKDKRCTLGAILFKHYEPAREIQEEFNDLIKRAEKVKANIDLNFSVGDEVFGDYTPSDDKFPDPSEVSQALDMDDELTCLVVEANDHSQRELRDAVEEARETAQFWNRPLSEDEGYQKAVRALKARVILEDELLRKKK